MQSARLVSDNHSISIEQNDRSDVLPAIPDDAPYNFRGRNILMLQGPVGPFFRRLAKDLQWAGANIHKINFNGGDWFYFPTNATSFTNMIDDFPHFLHRVCDEKNIDIIMLFGDCRNIHRLASEIAASCDIKVYVFEEGYIRPDYITMECHGVNGHSSMPSAGIFYLNSSTPEPAATTTVGRSIWHATGWAFIYYFWAIILWPFFPRYRHHRPLSWFEGLLWMRGTARKYWYRWKNRADVERLMVDNPPPFFLVPLQVHNDAQIGVHSAFDTIEQFIGHVVESFANHAADDALLVLKHHPMDRPYTDYTRLVRRLREETRLGNRLIYMHDPNLPKLIRKSSAMVTINSTTGISAIHHGKPTLALGAAIYRIEGLTASVTLDEFWNRAHEFPIHSDLYRNFRHQLIYRTQLNGNFYRRIKIPGTLAGIDWARGKLADDESS